MDFVNDQGSQQKKGQGEHCSIKIIVHQTGKESLVDDESSGITAGNLVDTWNHGGVPFELSNSSVANTMLGNLINFFVFSILSWGGLWCLWRWFNKQEKYGYINRIYTLISVILYALIVAVLANFIRFLSNRKARNYAWYVIDSNEEENKYLGKSNDVELSTFKVRKDTSPQDSVPVAPVEDPTHIPAVTFEMFQGRPNLESILGDLDNGTSPALFCCVPDNLAKHLMEGVDRKSRTGDVLMNNIAVYQESFEV